MKKIVLMFMMIFCLAGCATVQQRAVISNEPVYVDNSSTWTSKSKFGTWISFKVVNTKCIDVTVRVGCSRGSNLLAKKDVVVLARDEKVVSLLTSGYGQTKCGILSVK